jgi:Uma2 family endonuclease
MTTARASNRPFRFSREQYYRLGELDFFQGRRVERIHGEIVEMSPMGWNHFLATQLTADALRLIFHTTSWVSVQSPITLVDSDPEPDVAVYPGKPRDYTFHPSQALLVVEVAETSLAYDTTTKAELYATAGLADYWVLDLENRQLLVFRDPAPIPDGGSAYRQRLTFTANDTVSPLAMPTATVRVLELLP